MRMKVSNYISEMLVKAGIHQAFMVTGGGAMHLDDALGHQKDLHCIYDHHEQACAIAAYSIGRTRYGVANVLSTTNGILCACAICASLSISTTSEFGFPRVSTWIALVFSWMAASTCS